MRRTSVTLSVVALFVGIATVISAPGIAQQPAEQPSQWTIGIYTGPSLFDLSSPPNITNPVITPADVTDMEADIVAHPFWVVDHSRYYMFFTVKNSKAHTGGIGLAESANGSKWDYRRIVIDESYDLGYPYVFTSGGNYYMIPETHTEPSIRLYRATSFPDKWVYEQDILQGEIFISASIVRFQETWWMFVARSGNETLRLFYADDFRGPWTEHPKSPIIEKDLNIARPGGRPLVIDGSLYRITQDCDPTYGNQVFAFQVTDISKTTYSEKMIEKPIVKMTSKGWNAEAMHHVDLHRIGQDKCIAVVDALGK
ncbi:hypothetical protein ACFLT7_05545 [candidate division KSB1 bacterium]